MATIDMPPEIPKERPTKVCPYLGLLQDSQTALAFPSASNLCYNAKPLASPNLEYQSSFCLKGRQHTHCPVFIRSELAPLPTEITSLRVKKPLMGRPINKQIILLILLGLVVLILVVLGMIWLFNGHPGINFSTLPGKTVSSTATSVEIPSVTATYSVTNIAITPNVDILVISNTATPVTTPTVTATTQASQTPTMFVIITPIPVHTLVSCGRPNTWVVYYVQPGDSLYHLSVIYGVTVADLQRANCLGSSTTLHSGQILYVPPWAPIAPSPTTPFIVYPTAIPTAIPTDTPVIIPPTDIPTEPPVPTATEIPVATEIPSDTLVSP